MPPLHEEWLIIYVDTAQVDTPHHQVHEPSPVLILLNRLLVKRAIFHAKYVESMTFLLAKI